MNHYKHFNINDRELLLSLVSQGKSIRFIASQMRRSPSSISRELSRNACSNGCYSTHTAQIRYSQRRHNCGPKKKLLNTQNKEMVKSLFLKHQWSPEQISNRLRLENNKIQISYSTIYRGIYSGLLDEPDKTHGARGAAIKLRHRGKTRHKKGYVETRGKIQISNDLKDRPQDANDRKRIGDWEADTVAGKEGQACFVTLTDRKSRFLLCARVEKKSSVPVKTAIVEMLMCETKHTITPDRGKEFCRHQEVTEELNDVPLYFPLPHHP